MNELGIEQITADHSIVQEMIKKGEITKEEALNHPQKNIITRALGIQRGALPDYTEIELNKGDKVILCTDGLTNELSDEEIYKIVKTSAQEEVPENLIKEAKTRKGADNITVAVIA